MNRILNILAGFIIAVSFNLNSAEFKVFNDKVIKENFSITPSFDFTIKTDIKASYVDRKKVGDFSSIANYAFSYLNNMIVNASFASLSTIDCVIYSINMKDIPDALIAARDRGVKVRIIIDESHVYPRADAQIKKLIQAGKGVEVRTLRGTRSYGVTHNKITIFDKALVITGSYNWTFGATFSNYENLLSMRHPTYVKGYIDYFEWMWSKSRTIEQGASPEVPEGYYGKPPQSPQNMISLNGTGVPLYLFSPGSDTENKLASLIDAAKVSVDAVTFTFSSKPIADAIIRAHTRGVKVRFLQDKDMAKSSVMAKLVYEAGVPFRWTGGRNDKGAMHNKFIILDGQVLGTGSFNFTTNASVNSFENIVFTNDETIVKAYGSKFGWFYSQAITPASADEFDEVDTSKAKGFYTFTNDTSVEID
ncbi:MAG: hypothetical protein K6357_08865 [Elusimicrobiota bacterium]